MEIRREPVMLGGVSAVSTGGELELYSTLFRYRTSERIACGTSERAMTSPEAYKQQIEAGKEIVRSVLRDLAASMGEPRINSLTFVETHSDFDSNGISLLEPSSGKIVAKLKLEHLADAPATPSRRRQLEEQIQRAVSTFFGKG